VTKVVNNSLTFIREYVTSLASLFLSWLTLQIVQRDIKC